VKARPGKEFPGPFFFSASLVWGFRVNGEALRVCWVERAERCRRTPKAYGVTPGGA
jgi:hypothetical protein